MRKKRQSSQHCHFMLLCSASVKVVRKILIKLRPARKCDVEEFRIISEFSKCKRNVFLEIIPSEAKFLWRSHFFEIESKNWKKKLCSVNLKYTVIKESNQSLMVYGNKCGLNRWNIFWTIFWSIKFAKFIFNKLYSIEIFQ